MFNDDCITTWRRVPVVRRIVGFLVSRQPHRVLRDAAGPCNCFVFSSVVASADNGSIEQCFCFFSIILHGGCLLFIHMGPGGLGVEAQSFDPALLPTPQVWTVHLRSAAI